MRVFLAAAVLAGLLAPGLAGRGAVADAAARPAPAFANGAWTLSYLADVQISGPFPGGSRGTGSGRLTGTGIFDVTGGGVSGTHDAAGTAASTITAPDGESGPASLNIAIEGPVAGTADRAVLQGDVRASGSVSVSNGGLTTTFPLDFAGALRNGDGAPLSMFSVGCDRITGSWTVDLRGSGETPASGLSIAGPATFVAIRAPQSSDSAPPYARQLSQLLADIDGFVTRIGAEPLDTGALDAIAGRAESLSSSIPVVDDCPKSTTSRTPAFSTVLDVEIAQLLNAARAQLANVSTPDLAYLLMLGYRAGAIGTGSTWAGSTPLERVLRTELDRRGNVAAVLHDSTTATLVAVARRQFGVVNPARGRPKPAHPIKGVSTIVPETPKPARAERATMVWSPVDGAARYRVVLLDATQRPYWAWEGDTATVPADAAPTTAASGGSGPHITRGSTWTVVALDSSGRPIALSAPRPISP